MASTRIEWTEATWNPVTGCSKTSAGCAHCYAERMARRLHAMGVPQYANGFRVACHPEVLDRPLHWRRPQMVFVNSMSDLFHEDVPLAFIRDVFTVMHQARWHCFQVLTKRAERLRQLAPRLEWTPNVWMGVTVESADYVRRIDDLRQVPAAVRFLSLEPLLGPIPGLDLDGIHWVIVGGESGPGARPMQPAWVTDIRDQCLAAGVPFFFKQWGGINKKRAGRRLDRRTWSQVPVVVTPRPRPSSSSFACPALAGCSNCAPVRESRTTTSNDHDHDPAAASSRPRPSSSSFACPALAGSSNCAPARESRTTTSNDHDDAAGAAHRPRPSSSSFACPALAGSSNCAPVRKSRTTTSNDHDDDTAAATSRPRPSSSSSCSLPAAACRATPKRVKEGSPGSSPRRPGGSAGGCPQPRPPSPTWLWRSQPPPPRVARAQPAGRRLDRRTWSQVPRLPAVGRTPALGAPP